MNYISNLNEIFTAFENFSKQWRTCLKKKLSNFKSLPNSVCVNVGALVRILARTIPLTFSFGRKMENGSCNTFVVLPPLTEKGSIIFGKNSDRPAGEVQELIYEPPKHCTVAEPLKCTYIEVEQVDKTYGVILSKPAWMWGCEMGANDQGVVIGNEAVWTKVEDDKKERLLGMDLVRLGLERGKTAEESLDVITQLLAEHGQGGNCSDAHPDLFYHNSFLIADPNEAWVLETAGRHWVAQKIMSGYRNISNCLSIETQFDKSSPDVVSHSEKSGFWSGEGQFNFSAAYGTAQGSSLLSQKYLAGQELLNKYSAKNNFNVKDMFAILRDKGSGICSGLDSAFPTTASQVSVLSKTRPNCHWFTATPDPSVSVFKPFIFTPDVRISSYTKSPAEGDRRHTLYNLHATANSSSSNKVISVLQDMEQKCLEEVEKFLDDYQEGQSLSEVDELLKDVVETEVKFYK